MQGCIDRELRQSRLGMGWLYKGPRPCPPMSLAINSLIPSHPLHLLEEYFVHLYRRQIIAYKLVD